MPHIHTEKLQHDFTVTAYIVRVDQKEPKVLLHMHRKLKMLLPVGGHVELTETPWKAISHELEEESGYLLEDLVLLQPVSRVKHMTRVIQHPYPLSMNTHDIPTDHYHTDIEYGFIASAAPTQSFEEGESADLRWLTYDELMAVPGDLIYQNTREVYTFLIKEALEHWDRVDPAQFLLTFPDEYVTAS